VLVQHRGDLPPEVNPAQRDLPAGYEGEEEDQGRILDRQRPILSAGSAWFPAASLQSLYYFCEYQYDESGERPRGVRAAGLARSLLARHAPVVLGRLADCQYALG